MTWSLAIDTSADVRAGLARRGTAVAAAAVADPRAHAEQLMPLVRGLCADADITVNEIDEIVVGVGPGPFTGLRVGVVTALTLAETLGVPIKGVCSLDAIAAQWATTGAPREFVVVADARRREVYWARYALAPRVAPAGHLASGDGSGVQLFETTTVATRVDGPHVSAPDHVPPLPLAGPGAPLVRAASEGPDALDAGLMAALGESLPDAGLEPLYLRRPDAELPTRTKSTLVTPRRSSRRRIR